MKAASWLTDEMIRDVMRGVTLWPHERMEYRTNYAVDGVMLSVRGVISYAMLYGHDGCDGEGATEEAVQLLRENGHTVKLPEEMT